MKFDLDRNDFFRNGELTFQEFFIQENEKLHSELMFTNIFIVKEKIQNNYNKYVFIILYY